MANFDKAVKKVLPWEGGYVFHPADPGGETNRGITDKLDGVVDSMVDVDGDGEGDVPIKLLSEKEAKQVYNRKFWKAMKGEKIKSQNVANILFDGFVNMGPSAIKVLQRRLGIKDDGIVGPVTIAAINAAPARALFYDYKHDRIKYYEILADRKPSMKVFLDGWLNRINSFEWSDES